MRIIVRRREKTSWYKVDDIYIIKEQKPNVPILILNTYYHCDMYQVDDYHGIIARNAILLED
jgi:hypothetical protein